MNNNSVGERRCTHEAMVLVWLFGSDGKGRGKVGEGRDGDIGRETWGYGVEGTRRTTTSRSQQKSDDERAY